MRWQLRNVVVSGCYSTWQATSMFVAHAQADASVGRWSASAAVCWGCFSVVWSCLPCTLLGVRTLLACHLPLWFWPWNCPHSVLPWISYSGLTFLDLVFLPLHQLPLLELTLPLASRRTCMSGQPSIAEAISSTATALRAIAENLEAVARHSEQLSGNLPPLGTEESDWDRVSSVAPSDQLPVRPSLAESSSRSGPPEFAGYDSVAANLTGAPAVAFDLCSKVGTSTEESRRRTQRAWEAGLWARAVLEKKVPKPRPTPKLSLRPQVYVILRAPGLSRPCRCGSAAEYFGVLPQFTEDSLSHSFPSLGEAKVYCLAVGIDFPAGPGEQWLHQMETFSTWQIWRRWTKDQRTSMSCRCQTSPPMQMSSKVRRRFVFRFSSADQVSLLLCQWMPCL